MKPMKTKSTVVLAFAVALLTVAIAQGGAPKDLRFTDVKAQTQEFLGYEKSIQLSPEQEAVKKAALSAIPAPCCSDNTQYTCCCPCNFSRTVWGLSNHLIADLGYDAAGVRAKVTEWTRFVNPGGYSGDTCYKGGGCAKPFAKGGCGGMKEPVAF
jgi:hypothetical protein